jgi:hypothetical protein
MKWTEDELSLAKNLIDEGKNFKDIGKILGRSQAVVTKKLHRLGYKSPYKPSEQAHIGKTKYSELNWNGIQNAYDTGLSHDDLQRQFNLSTRAVLWGVQNGKLKSRSVSDSLKLAWESGKCKGSALEGFKRYRQLCEFKFSLKDFPTKFDFTLVEKFGWYQASNRGNNLNGVSRDHMFSIKEGFLNNVDRKIISHPANCALLLHTDNSRKKDKSSISLQELMERIKNWNI